MLTQGWCKTSFINVIVAFWLSLILCENLRGDFPSFSIGKEIKGVSRSQKRKMTILILPI